MSILNPIVPTIESQVASITSLNTHMLKTLEFGVAANFRTIFANKYYTPEQMLAQIGADFAKLVQASTDTQILIATYDPTYVPQVPPVAFTINPDGTGTITPPAPVDETTSTDTTPTP